MNYLFKDYAVKIVIMQISYDDENKLKEPETYIKIMEALKSKEHINIVLVKEMLNKICSNGYPLFEPYLLQIMNSICNTDSYISNKNKVIRTIRTSDLDILATTTVKPIIANKLTII